jgi:aspartate/methionine/tyrosine aminotransferase
MFMSILMFGEPGADILYPDPGFPIYRSMIEYTGARPIPVPVREQNGFAFSAEETLKLITPQTRLLVLNSPANPTGGVTGKAEVDKLSLAQRAGRTCVMSDEIYDHMVYDGRCMCALIPVDPRPADPSTAGATGAMTGWRPGYAVWLPKLYEHARKIAEPVLPRQRLGAICGLAALKGPAGRGEQDGRRIRQSTQLWWRAQ